MRVVYEINLEDMRNILAEKYEIDSSKIEFMGHGDLVFARIDVSETETPGKVNFLVESEKWEKVKAPEKQEEAEDDEADRYGEITDGILEDYIKQGYTIPQICGIYKLTDSKYSARLYKRAEQFRKEGARLGRKRNKEKAEDSEPGTE